MFETAASPAAPKPMSMRSRASLNAIATDTHGAAKCMACSREWKVWYVGLKVIGRIYCNCEIPTHKVNRFGMKV